MEIIIGSLVAGILLFAGLESGKYGLRKWKARRVYSKRKIELQKIRDLAVQLQTPIFTAWQSCVWDLEQVVQQWAKSPEQLRAALVEAKIPTDFFKCEDCEKRFFDQKPINHAEQKLCEACSEERCQTFFSHNVNNGF